MHGNDGNILRTMLICQSGGLDDRMPSRDYIINDDDVFSFQWNRLDHFYRDGPGSMPSFLKDRDRSTNLFSDLFHPLEGFPVRSNENDVVMKVFLDILGNQGISGEILSGDGEQCIQGSVPVQMAIDGDYFIETQTKVFSHDLTGDRFPGMEASVLAQI